MTPTMRRYAGCSVNHTAIEKLSSLPNEITKISIHGVGEHATGVENLKGSLCEN